MADMGGTRFRSAFTRRSAWPWLCALGLVMGGPLVAQDIALPAKDGAPATLHVYKNLVQIPVLVLGSNGERMAEPIVSNQFSVSIGSGPWFHATHVRIEGDDPISLSILLDVNGDGAALMPKIDDAIAGLAPLSLHAKDHVSIYALDCSLIRGLNDVPADAAGLKRGVDGALAAWTARTESRQKCKQTVHLRDALAYLIGEMHSLPGPRVILAVSDGEDWASKVSWSNVTYYAQIASTTIFGVRDYSAAANQTIVRTGLVQQRTVSGPVEDPFNSLCQLSGGMLLMSDNAFLWDRLTWFTTMLRERYIVEYPRPLNSTAGRHGMEVRVDKGNYFIRPAGASMPLPDAAVLADPTTVPADPSKAPVQGKRRMLDH